jgi:hypothetical protein
MRAIGVNLSFDPGIDPMSPAQSIVSSYKERIAFANMQRAELGDVALAKSTGRHLPGG